uniref:Uncharacterized protein n=1 Tax=Knipowitschia caucasica TaxID=637954 RepID=A0AAV2MBG6_KNICA
MTEASSCSSTPCSLTADKNCLSKSEHVPGAGWMHLDLQIRLLAHGLCSFGQTPQKQILTRRCNICFTSHSFHFNLEPALTSSSNELLLCLLEQFSHTYSS